jgi:hypothetical protein
VSFIRSLLNRLRYLLQRLAVFCRLAYWSAPVIAIGRTIVVAPGVLKFTPAEREEIRSHGFSIVEDPKLPSRTFVWGRPSKGEGFHDPDEPEPLRIDRRMLN